MPNRQLTKQELENLAYPLLKEIRSKLETLSGGDEDLLWGLRRKITKELGYGERSKPAHRIILIDARRDNKPSASKA
jgi:hypothetical protein